MANPAVISNRGMFVALDGSNLGTLPVDARLDISSLISDDGSAPLAVRQGIFYDGGAAAVTGTTDTGTMTYQLRACSLAFYLLGTIASGTVLVCNAGNLKVDTTAAPGTNSRIDVIWVRQRVTAADGGSDSVNTPILGCTQGTAAASPTVPAIPTGAYAIAQAVVTAGTTQTSTVTITQVHNWAATAGSPIPCRNATEMNALTAYLGMQVMRLDQNARIFTYNGSAWIGESVTKIFSGTTAASTGLLVVTHGLGFTPTGAVCTPLSPTNAGSNASILMAVLPVDTFGFTSTQFEIRALNATPAFMTSTAITFAATFTGG